MDRLRSEGGSPELRLEMAGMVRRWSEGEAKVNNAICRQVCSLLTAEATVWAGEGLGWESNSPVFEPCSASCDCVTGRPSSGFPSQAAQVMEKIKFIHSAATDGIHTHVQGTRHPVVSKKGGSLSSQALPGKKTVSNDHLITIWDEGS